jgi:hypothetical protein
LSTTAPLTLVVWLASDVLAVLVRVIVPLRLPTLPVLDQPKPRAVVPLALTVPLVGFKVKASVPAFPATVKPPASAADVLVMFRLPGVPLPFFIMRRVTGVGIVSHEALLLAITRSTQVWLPTVSVPKVYFLPAAVLPTVSVPIPVP